nr:unnamed protein product [Digitaria exilis]
MECLPVLFHALLLCLSLIVSSLPGSCVDAGDENFVFSGFAGAGAGNLTLGDAAKVTPEGLLQLTNNTETTKGNAFYPTPLRFKDYSSSPNGTARSFSAAFVFAIVSAYGEEASTDGMAFLIAPTTDLSDAGWSQYMGFLDGAAMDRTFAVELDTYKNAELRDIDSNHAGVHVGGLFSTDSHAAAFHDDSNGGGALTGLSLDSGEAMQAWVDYDGKSKRVNVTLAPMGVAKPSTPLLSDVSDDLSAVLTERAYVGFSAATGPIKTRHYVLAWSFAMDGPAPPIDFTKMPKLPRSGRSNKTFKTMALPIIAAASALVLLAACSITLLRRRLKYAELREDWEVLLQGSVPRDGRVQEQQHPRRGGFGKVYKGVLPKSRSEVAVKRVSHESSQGIKEFISEVVSIGHLRHRNLVVGYCRRKGELLLVSGADPQGGQGGPPTPLWPTCHAATSARTLPHNPVSINRRHFGAVRGDVSRRVVNASIVTKFEAGTSFIFGSWLCTANQEGELQHHLRGEAVAPASPRVQTTPQGSRKSLNSDTIPGSYPTRRSTWRPKQIQSRADHDNSAPTKGQDQATCPRLPGGLRITSESRQGSTIRTVTATPRVPRNPGFNSHGTKTSPRGSRASQFPFGLTSSAAVHQKQLKKKVLQPRGATSDLVMTTTPSGVIVHWPGMDPEAALFEANVPITVRDIQPLLPFQEGRELLVTKGNKRTGPKNPGRQSCVLLSEHSDEEVVSDDAPTEEGETDADRELRIERNRNRALRRRFIKKKNLNPEFDKQEIFNSPVANILFGVSVFEGFQTTPEINLAKARLEAAAVMVDRLDGGHSSSKSKSSSRQQAPSAKRQSSHYGSSAGQNKDKNRPREEPRRPREEPPRSQRRGEPRKAKAEEAMETTERKGAEEMDHVKSSTSSPNPNPIHTKSRKTAMADGEGSSRSKGTKRRAEAMKEVVTTEKAAPTGDMPSIEDPISDWPISNLKDKHIKTLEADGFLAAQEISRWRCAYGHEYPTEETEELTPLGHTLLTRH